jgi:hypothetical protein
MVPESEEDMLVRKRAMMLAEHHGSGTSLFNIQRNSPPGLDHAASRSHERMPKQPILSSAFATILFLGVLGSACRQGAAPTAQSTKANRSDTAASEPLPKECTSVDESNVQSVATCYNALAVRNQPSTKWRFTSKRTQAEVSQQQWVDAANSQKRNCETVGTQAVGEDQARGNSLARVSVRLLCDDRRLKRKCSSVDTQTWISEDGKWRILEMPKTAEITRKTFSSGDFFAARRSAERWLEIDPYSISAKGYLLFATTRTRMPEHEYSNLRDGIVRSMLSINPQDSVTLSDTIAFAPNVDLSKAHLNRLPDDDCEKPHAVSNMCAKIADQKKVLAFLNEQHVTSPYIIMRRVLAMAAVGQGAGISDIMSPETAGGIESALKDDDPSFATSMAAKLAGAMLKIGNRQTAQHWADIGLMRDPSNKELQKVLHELK